MFRHTPVHLELLVQHQRKETSDKRVLVERVLVLVQVKWQYHQFLWEKRKKFLKKYFTII